MTKPAGHEDETAAARLRALRIDPPDGGFQAALRRRLAAEPPPAAPGWLDRLVEAWRHPPRLAWPAVAAAAAAALLLVLSPWHAPPAGARGPSALPPAPTEALAAVAVPATKVAMVRLDLSVDVAIASADIRVTLPDGLVFWSRGEALADRSFEWSQPLAAGRNEIPIAVRGQHPGRYHVTVTARVGDDWISHDVPLDVVDG